VLSACVVAACRAWAAGVASTTGVMFDDRRGFACAPGPGDTGCVYVSCSADLSDCTGAREASAGLRASSQPVITTVHVRGVRACKCNVCCVRARARDCLSGITSVTHSDSSSANNVAMVVVSSHDLEVLQRCARTHALFRARARARTHVSSGIARGCDASARFCQNTRSRTPTPQSARRRRAKFLHGVRQLMGTRAAVFGAAAAAPCAQGTLADSEGESAGGGGVPDGGEPVGDVAAAQWGRKVRRRPECEGSSGPLRDDESAAGDEGRVGRTRKRAARGGVPEVVEAGAHASVVSEPCASPALSVTAAPCEATRMRARREIEGVGALGKEAVPVEGSAGSRTVAGGVGRAAAKYHYSHTFSKHDVGMRVEIQCVGDGMVPVLLALSLALSYPSSLPLSRAHALSPSPLPACSTYTHSRARALSLFHHPPLPQTHTQTNTRTDTHTPLILNTHACRCCC